jgi:hypothetical protein
MSDKQHQLFAVTYWLLHAATLLIFLLIGAMVLALFALLGASAFGLLTQAEVLEVVQDLGMGARQIVLVGAFALLSALACTVLLLFAVMLTTRIVESAMNGNPFVPQNADRLMQIGWLLLAINVAGWFIEPMLEMMVPEKLADGISFDMSPMGLLGILLIFVLAQIFRHGTALRADLEGTV